MIDLKKLYQYIEERKKNGELDGLHIDFYEDGLFDRLYIWVNEIDGEFLDNFGHFMCVNVIFLHLLVNKEIESVEEYDMSKEYGPEYYDYIIDIILDMILYKCVRAYKEAFENYKAISKTIKTTDYSHYDWSEVLYEE